MTTLTTHCVMGNYKQARWKIRQDWQVNQQRTALLQA